jgi:hypothetical protein
MIYDLQEAWARVGDMMEEYGFGRNTFVVRVEHWQFSSSRRETKVSFSCFDNANCCYCVLADDFATAILLMRAKLGPTPNQKIDLSEEIVVTV